MTIPVTFGAVSRLHHTARTCTPRFQWVRHEAFDRFCLEVRDASRLERRDEDLDRLVRALRRYRFLASAAPLPFNSPALDPMLTLPEAERWKDRGWRIWGEQTATVLGQALDGYVALRGSDESPTLPPLVDLLNQVPGGRRAVVLPSSRLIDSVQVLLADRYRGQDVSVCTLQALRLPRAYDLLLVVGSPRWMPPFVFSAPRSSCLHVIGYSWCADRPRITPAFANGLTLGAPASVEHTDAASSNSWAAPAWADIEDHVPDWSAIASTGAAALGQAADDFSGEDVEARLHLLTGGDAVFLEAEDSASALVINLDHPHRRVHRVRIRDIEPGMFILLRSGESGDYILPVADELLGEARDEYRSTQREWKRRLREQVIATGRIGSDGLQIVARRLQASAPDSSEINDGHLRRWMSDRNISPQSRQHFNAVMELIGLAAEQDRYWLVMKRIHRAHTRAGFLIKRRIVQLAETLDPAALLATGRMDFRSAAPSGDGIQLTAYLVERIAPAAHYVAASQLGRPFPWRDA